MERAHPTPSGGIRPVDLVALAERPGPFATVLLGRTGTGAWGRQSDDIRVGDALSALSEAGAPESATDAVGEALDGVSSGAGGVVVIADERAVLLVEELAEAPRRDIVRWAPLPSVGGVIEHRQADVPAIIVLADRTGADLVVTSPGDDDVSLNVEGNRYPITKSAPGGWSQRRYQQRAQDSWERNADDVADQVRALAAATFPDLVVLGGDERAVTLIGEALSDELRAVTRTITAGRAADGSEDRRDHDIATLLRTVAAEATVKLLEAFREQSGSASRAANGVSATLAALGRSQVDVLLVHDDTEDERVAWFSTDASVVSERSEDLEAFGAAGIATARLVDVAINAALRTGAGVRVVPDAASVDGGLAAILRWSDATA